MHKMHAFTAAEYFTLKIIIHLMQAYKKIEVHTLPCKEQHSSDLLIKTYDIEFVLKRNYKLIK